MNFHKPAQSGDTMDFLGAYSERPFPKNRKMVIDVVRLGLAKHHAKGFIEVDVTSARQYLQAYKERTGERLSFTGWIIKCIAQAVSENEQVHAMRKGKGKVIIFNDVDILVTVEKLVNGENIPLPYVVRKSNEKSVAEITQEIRTAQSEKVEHNDVAIGESHPLLKLYQLLPGFIRRIIGHMIMKNPSYIKKNTGTVGISSVGVMGNFHGWMMPISPQPLYFALGSVAKKAGVVGDGIEIREYLSMSFLFDHDVVDGAPMARFMEQLVNLIESAFALKDL